MNLNKIPCLGVSSCIFMRPSLDYWGGGLKSLRRSADHGCMSPLPGSNFGMLLSAFFSDLAAPFRWIRQLGPIRRRPTRRRTRVAIRARP
jgi:hypothetical protein